MKLKKLIISIVASTFLFSTTAFSNAIDSDMEGLIKLLESQGYTVDYSNIVTTTYDGIIDEPTAKAYNAITVDETANTIPSTVSSGVEKWIGNVIQYDGQGYWIRKVVGQNYVLEEVFGTGAKREVSVKEVSSFMEAQEQYIIDNNIHIKENGVAEGGKWDGFQRRFIYYRPNIDRQIEPLTEAPVVGTALGNILKDGVDTNRNTRYYSNELTENYMSGSIGQCTWYVRGRWKEVYGLYDKSMSTLELSNIGGTGTQNWIENAKKYDSLIAIDDIYDIRPQTIGVYQWTSDPDVGHVVFIEYVEYDEYGNPLNVYITHANLAGDGTYIPGRDGVVEKYTFEQFYKWGGAMNLLGYIAPNIQE